MEPTTSSACIFKKVKERIRETEFNSVSDYVTYVLTEIVEEVEPEKPLTNEDEERVVVTLKALGYID